MGDGPNVVAVQDLRLAIGRVARRLRQLYATEREGAANFIELGILVRLCPKTERCSGRRIRT